MGNALCGPNASWDESKSECTVSQKPVTCGDGTTLHNGQCLIKNPNITSMADCAKAQGITDGDAMYYAYCKENGTYYCGPVNSNGNAVCHGANYCNGTLLTNACLQYDS